VTRGPVVGEAEVAAFEDRCRFHLPPDYRRFLLEQNGGERPLPPRPPEEDEDEGRHEVVRFFSLGAAATVAVPHDTVLADPERWFEEWAVLMTDLTGRMAGARDFGTRSFPPELLPVADLSLGMLLVRLKGRGTGAVLHCYDPDGYEPGHVNKAAASFAELLRDLDDSEWS
jgi:hypothetical protein